MMATALVPVGQEGHVILATAYGADRADPPADDDARVGLDEVALQVVATRVAAIVVVSREVDEQVRTPAPIEIVIGLPSVLHGLEI